VREPTKLAGAVITPSALYTGKSFDRLEMKFTSRLYVQRCTLVIFRRQIWLPLSLPPSLSLSPILPIVDSCFTRCAKVDSHRTMRGMSAENPSNEQFGYAGFYEITFHGNLAEIFSDALPSFVFSPCHEHENTSLAHRDRALGCVTASMHRVMSHNVNRP